MGAVICEQSEVWADTTKLTGEFWDFFPERK